MVHLQQPTLFGQEEFISFQKRIEFIYDHLYANGSVRTPTGICAEVGKILHIGLYREEVLKHVPAFYFPRSEVKDMLNGVGSYRSNLIAQIKHNFNEMNTLWGFYGKNSAIQLSEFDLCYVCSQLSGIQLSDKKKDIFGDAIEIFRSEWVKRSGGQFFTDQRVTALAMELLEFDPRQGDDLIDICAGTGGFLLAGLNRIRELLEQDHPNPNVSLETELVKLASASLHGQEVDRDVCEVANATLLARLGNGGKRIVFHADSLGTSPCEHTNGLLQLGRHLCAASNPPFGTKITVKDPDILQQYELARRVEYPSKSLQLSPRAPDILFLERNVHMLKPGKGKLAIVLPYQLLSGPKAVFVRAWLLKHTKLLAVVDLPPETFQPHTGTKTSLVLVQRKSLPLQQLETEEAYDIFMAIPRWIGHDRRGYPVYKRTPTGKITNEILTDFGEVTQAWKLFLQGQSPQQAYDQCFTVNYRAIVHDPLLRINALYHTPSHEIATQREIKQASNAWRVVKLETLVKKIFYPGRFKRHYIEPCPGAVPFLGGSNITEFLVSTDKWLDPHDPKLESLRVYAGWILITRSGTTGIVASVPQAWDGFAMSEHIIRIVPAPEKLDPAYLLAFLRSQFAQKQLARGVFGSVIDEITSEYIGQLDIFIPTSAQELHNIISSIKAAEEARQQGIMKYAEAIDDLEQRLVNERS